ncbi:MAG: hypothetical protein ABSA47_15015, partial [Verrucomicrobiota bacterium]
RQNALSVLMFHHQMHVRNLNDLFLMKQLLLPVYPVKPGGQKDEKIDAQVAKASSQDKDGSKILPGRHKTIAGEN